jgi:hypothetical protein
VSHILDPWLVLGLHALRPLPYFAMMAVLPAIGIPISPLYILAGASFGIAVGLVGSLVALAVNATLCYWISSRLRPLPVTAVATFILLAIGNVISTVLLCGAGFCPETPGGYLIFNDNLRVTMFAGAL